MLTTAIADDRARRIPGQLGLEVMKHLIAEKKQDSNKRVLDVYRLLRMRGYIGRGGPERARVTTMATWYGVRAAEVGGAAEGGGGGAGSELTRGVPLSFISRLFRPGKAPLRPERSIGPMPGEMRGRDAWGGNRKLILCGRCLQGGRGGGGDKGCGIGGRKANSIGHR